MTAEETAANIISKVGLWWPLAEEDQLRQAAAAYERVATAVLAAAETGSSGARLVTGGGNRGEAIDAFDKHWAQFDGECEAGLPATAQAASNVAAALKQFADEVDDAKKKIIDLAIEIGATIAVGVGMALFTFGGSAAAASARTAMLVARGWMIARGLSSVAATIVTALLAGATFGAVEGFVSSIVAQVGKQVLNDGPGITLSETMSWTATGAAAGAATAGLGVAARGGVRALAASSRPTVSRIGTALGGGGRALNSAGRPYPGYVDPRTGRPVQYPGGDLAKIPKAERVTWSGQERAAHIKEWYDRGLPTPLGGWADYDIHHIRPREYGGTNDFDNLLPVPRPIHQNEFNAWWRDY